MNPIVTKWANNEVSVCHMGYAPTTNTKDVKKSGIFKIVKKAVNIIICYKFFLHKACVIVQNHILFIKYYCLVMQIFKKVKVKAVDLYSASS